VEAVTTITPRFIHAAARETGHEAMVGNNLNGLRLARTLRLDEPARHADPPAD
jgi:hypothetical protein